MQEIHSLFHNGCNYSTKCILQQDMGGDLIMNSDLCSSDRVISVGIGNSNQLLKLHNEGLLGLQFSFHELADRATYSVFMCF